MKKTILLLIVLYMLIPSVVLSAEKPGWKWITAKRVYSLINEGSGLWLVDVRSEHAFNEGHIEGAINIPGMSLKVKQMPENRFIVLADNSIGQRLARDAAEILVQKGMKKVFVLKGGISSWSTAGYPAFGEAGMRTGAVTVRDLKWAMENGIKLDLYDLRGDEAFKEGSIPGSAMVKGATLEERVGRLQESFNNQKKEKNLAKRLNDRKETVLVFSASDDAGYYTEQIAFADRGYVRYLIGGYETFAMAGKRGEKVTIGNCPVCPNAGQ